MPSTSVQISMRSASRPGPDDGRRIIRSAAPDGGGDSRLGGADEATHDRHSPCVQHRLHLRPQPLVGFFHQGSGPHVLIVGDDALARIDHGGIKALRGKRGRDNPAGENFTESGHVIGGARSQFADRSDAAQQFVQRFEVNSQIAVEFGEERRAQQFARGVVVPLAQGARKTRVRSCDRRFRRRAPSSATGR